MARANRKTNEQRAIECVRKIRSLHAFAADRHATRGEAYSEEERDRDAALVVHGALNRAIAADRSARKAVR